MNPPSEATVLYDCPFVPAEWIAAHGLRPCRPWLAMSVPPLATLPQDGVCPYTRAFLSTVLTTPARGAIFSTGSDQMRRAYEIARDWGQKSVFLFHLPATWQTSAATHYYLEELERLGRFLTGLGGQAPNHKKLLETMLAFDDARRLLRDSQGRLSPLAFARAMQQFHETGLPEFVPSDEPPANPPGKSRANAKPIPLALVGSPLTREHLAWFELVEQYGGQIVLHGATHGERTLPAPLNRRLLHANPLQAMVEAYFGAIPEVSQRPNSRLYSWLNTELARRNVRGIIYRYFVWSDPWHAEAQRLKEWAGMPLLALEIGDEPAITAHTAGRLQSFMELFTSAPTPRQRGKPNPPNRPD